MAQTRKAERAQVIVDPFRAGHTNVADEIVPFIDRIIHRLGDDATDPGRLVRDCGAVPLQNSPQVL